MFYVTAYAPGGGGGGGGVVVVVVVVVVFLFILFVTQFLMRKRLVGLTVVAFLSANLFAKRLFQKLAFLSNSSAITSSPDSEDSSESNSNLLLGLFFSDGCDGKKYGEYIGIG